MVTESTDEPRTVVATAEAPTAVGEAGATPWWRYAPVRRRIGYASVAAVFVTITLVWGVPQKDAVIIGFVLVLLAISRIGRGRRNAIRMLIDWLPFAAVLLIYDQSRRLGTVLGAPLHEADVAHAEKWLFGGTVPTIWLQQHLYTPGHVHWFDAVFTLVYTTHFLATPVIAGVLWLVSRDAWLRYITRVVVVSVAGLITYLAFPEAPPWLAAKDAVIAPVTRLSANGWIWLHAGNVSSLLARAQDEGSNPVAAMPSLHTAMAVLVAIALAGQLRTRWRWLLALYPLTMAFTLVYDGEHYVLDIVAGTIYALAAHVALRTWERRRAARGLGPFDFVAGSLRTPAKTVPERASQV